MPIALNAVQRREPTPSPEQETSSPGRSQLRGEAAQAASLAEQEQALAPGGRLDAQGPAQGGPPADFKRAEAANRGNIKNVVRFDRATQGAFAKRNGQLDAAGVARWQQEHGLPATGEVDDKTCDAAEGKGGQTPPAPDSDPKKPKLGPVHHRIQELIIELTKLRYVESPNIDVRYDALGAITLRVELWKKRHELHLEALRLMKLYDNGPYARHPHLDQLTGLLTLLPHDMILVDFDFTVIAHWTTLSAARDELYEQYRRSLVVE